MISGATTSLHLGTFSCTAPHGHELLSALSSVSPPPSRQSPQREAMRSPHMVSLESPSPLGGARGVSPSTGVCAGQGYTIAGLCGPGKLCPSPSEKQPSSPQARVRLSQHCSPKPLRGARVPQGQADCQSHHTVTWTQGILVLKAKGLEEVKWPECPRPAGAESGPWSPPLVCSSVYLRGPTFLGHQAEGLEHQES